MSSFIDKADAGVYNVGGYYGNNDSEEVGMITITDLKQGMMLEFTHPTSTHMYTNGMTYEVFRVMDDEYVQLMDNTDFPHDWDINHIGKQFKIVTEAK